MCTLREMEEGATTKGWGPVCHADNLHWTSTKCGPNNEGRYVAGANSRLGQDNGDVRWYSYCGNCTSCIGYDSKYSGRQIDTISLNKWHNMSLISDGSSYQRLYLDGILIDSISNITYPNSFTSSSNVPIILGKQWDGGSEGRRAHGSNTRHE